MKGYIEIYITLISICKRIRTSMLTKGLMTPGINGMTLDGFGDRRVDKLIESLKDHSYQPASVKRVYIPKKNGKMRPLGIASSDDKLVQEIIRMVLESIYEPTFSNLSHGFRAKRSCHTALLQIQHNFTGVKWFVEGDIKAYFDTIDHHILMDILRRRIKDEAFLELIWKFLRAGYLEKWEYNATYSGVAQGSGFSPILANIYLNELDKYMEDYIQSFKRGIYRAWGKAYGRIHGNYQRYNNKLKITWNSLSDAEKKTALKEKKRLRKEFLSVPASDPMDENYRRLQYTRYADDFIIGVIGSHEDAEKIKTDIKAFLADKLKLELSDDKTLVTSGKDKARFLSYDITVCKDTSTKKTSRGQSRSYYDKIKLYVPKEKWFGKLLQYDVLKIISASGECERWMPLQRDEYIEKAECDRVAYRADNLKTGRSVALGHRPDKLPIDKYPDVASRMGVCAAGDKWILADSEPGEFLKQARLEDILRIAFEKILPKHGFAPRGKQIELAQEILESFCRLDVSLAEAEVGTGKTLAYLLPAVLARRSKVNGNKINTILEDGSQAPIVIATSSIALQRAIEQEYIPALSKILLEHGVIKTPLTRVLRKGKGHYLCEKRLSHYRSFADAETKKILEPLVTGGIADLATAKNLTPYIKRSICVVDRCGQDCPKYGACRYMRHMREAKRGGYDFQVCNHNYFLADILRRAQGKRPLIPDYQAVIIDEAHKFLDAARSMYGCSLSLSEFINIVRDLREFTFAPGIPTADIRQELDKVTPRAGLLFQFLNKEVPVSDDEDESAERYATKIRERTEKLIRALNESIDSLYELLKAKPVLIKYETRKKEILWVLERISNSLGMFSKHNDLVYWLEEPAQPCTEQLQVNALTRDIRFPILNGIPKNLGELLYQDIWSQKVPIILTSGTMSAAGSFEHIKRKMGLDLLPKKRLTETSKPSPFNHRENALLYISESTPFPDNTDQSYIEAVTDEVEKLITASHGHAAVLFTSYKAMDMVYERITARKLDYPLFRLDRGGAAAIERFKNSGNGVLFASGALWEGIDIPGDILSMLIIVRLPFAVPDPVSEWERTLYDNMDEYKAMVVVPEMLIKLKQGFGRLIRTISDTGVVAILDFRASTRGTYRTKILDALPLCRATSSVAVVGLFIQNKKTPAYFKNGLDLL